MPIARILFVILSVLVASPCFSLDVSRVKNNEYTLLLSGKIVPGDLDRILKAVSPPNPFPKYFTINSNGGNILEAIKIGRFIRETASGTLVTKNCSSACVFVFVGGVSKTALASSSIGLHRPYFQPETYSRLSLNEVVDEYGKVRKVTRDYLEEMEVPTRYIDKMFSIASDDVYFLSESEKKRLSTSPAAYSEWIQARCGTPTARDWKQFEMKGYNFFDESDDPEYVAFMSKYNQAKECEESVVADIRKQVLRKYLRP